MPWTCARCGTGNHDTLGSCAACGAAYAPSAQPPGATQYGAPAGVGAPAGYGAPAQLPYGPPAQNPYAQPYGAPYGGPYGGVPYGAVAPARRDNSWTLGCLLASGLGVLAILGLVTALVLVSHRDASGRAHAASHEPAGKLVDAMPKTVGRYALVSVKPLRVDGAVDAVEAFYRAGDIEIDHALVAFADEAAAERHCQGVIAHHEEKAHQSGEPIRITNENQKVIGEGRLYKTSPEVFAYHVGKLSGLIYGPPGSVKEYFRDTPL